MNRIRIRSHVHEEERRPCLLSFSYYLIVIYLYVPLFEQTCVPIIWDYLSQACLNLAQHLRSGEGKNQARRG